MPSIMAQEVAKDVLSKVRGGKKVNLQEIQVNHGYTVQSAKAMKATRTKTYKQAVKPIVLSMERERNRIMAELSNKDLTKERFRDLVEGMDKLTKNIQLLSGGATENIAQPIANIFIKTNNAVFNSNQHTEDSEPSEED